jgi:phage terminase Nu1 subunit (DNA packaging protein)
MSSKLTLKSCPVSHLAKLYGITERRVQQLAKEGVFVRDHHGEYDLVASVRSYTEYFRSLVEKEDEPLKHQRLRLLKAQADRAEEENRQSAKTLVEIALVGDFLEDVALHYATCIDAFPGKLAHELINIQDPAVIKAKLFQECRILRQATAKRLQQFADSLERAHALRETA